MLTIKAPQSFKAKVTIPAPGGAEVAFTAIFRHRSRSELHDWVQVKGRTDEQTIMDCLAGWEGVDADFSTESVALMLEQYHAAPRVIVETYVDELMQARLGN